MKKFNLVKSLTRVINNNKGLLILCLSLATFGVESAWALRYAGAYVYSSPTTGGYVYVTKTESNVPSGWTGTSDSSEDDNAKISDYTFNFWAYARVSNDNYIFKGWATSDNTNSVVSTTATKYNIQAKATSSNNTSGKRKKEYRYAIFARMTADISSKDFGNVNVGQSSSATTITVTHAHASKITAALSGTNTSDFSLSTTTIVDNSVSEGTATFTVTFKPTCNGTRTATLTLSSTNGLSDVTISLSGTGVLNSQSLSWNNESAIELNMLNGTTQNISATATSGLAISYSSSNPDVLSVDATGKLTAKSVGEATITVSQSGDCTYSAATSISKTFNVKTKDTPIFTPNWSSTEMKVGDKVTLGVQYVSDGLSGDFKATDYDSKILKVTRENNTITIEALNEGSSNVTFAQTETDAIFGATKTYSFNVSKIDNTLSVADASPTMYVGDNLVDKISTNSDATINVSFDDKTIADYDLGSQTIIAQNTGNQSFNSKEVTITISQEATYKYTAAEKTIKVTVSKWDNHISINGNQDSYAANAFMDGYAQINLTATNTDYAGSPITATQTAGTDIATFYPDDKVVYSTYKLGDATWNVSQPENYKYKAANASFTIHVVQEAEATDCYVLNDPNEYSASTHIYSFEGVSIHTYTINKPYSHIWFDAYTTGTKGYYFIQYSTDNGSNYSDLANPNVSGSYKPFDYDLPKNTTNIRFYAKTGATGTHYVKNVRVSRKIYLNASDFTINTQEDNTTLVYPGTTGTGSFQVDYSLANGGDLKIVCDNPKFTIDKTTQTDVDCKSGSFDVNMTYTSQTAGTDYAHVIIYNNVYRKEITVTGITQKHQQTLKWKDNFDQMSVGGEEKNAASSSRGLVTYKSDDPNIIRVDNDEYGNATILVAVAKGETKITATAAGDDEYAEISIEKTISVTEKCVQYIVWTQSLMGLKLNDPNRILNAYATSEIEECTSNNGGRLVTYTSADESVVKVVNTNELQIVGVGTTTVTAYQAGGLDSDEHEYEPASKVNTVVVKDPSAKCEAFVYKQNGDAEQFFQMNTNEIKGTEHTLSGEPAKITFYAKREYWNLAINYSKGNIVLDAYTPTGGWQQVLDCGEPPIGSYKEYSINLNRDVTKIRFRRPSGGQGYHYIADAKVEMLRYIETSTPSTFQANVGEQQQQTIYLSYSNITSDLLLSMASGANSHFSVDKTQITGDCGAVAKNVALTISYAPTKNTEELGEETETLIITDGTTTTNVALKGTANRVARSIVWDINDQNTVYTVQTVNLNATAKTNLQQEAGNVAYNISSSSTEGCGSINNNVLSFAKAGNVSVVATTIEDAKYLPAVAVTKSWTVNLTPTEVVTKPEIDGDIVYGAQLTDLKLKANTGSARNTVNQQTVEGSFSITGGDLSAAGEKTITVTFTPANTDMYASCTSSVSVTIQKKESDAIAHASEIIYGAAVGTSILTNEGTTNGIWTWTDEKKDQVLEVGTHEGLNVHFTPTDKTNYNEIDGTVSLTVKKAAATLTWTTAPESADVKDKLTYTATSNHSESAIIYAITEGADCATIDASTGALTITKAGTITVQASQDASTHYEAATAITVTTTLTGEFENVFSGEGDWNDPKNWTYGVPTSDNPDVVISGNMTIGQSISVGSLTIEAGGSVTIVVEGDLTVNGTSKDRDTYGNLFVRNGGDVTISENANVKVFDFVVESSIGTEGQSVSGQVKHSNRVLYTNGAYIDINMDSKGKMDDTQWYAFTVPFPVDVQSGIARKEGDVFRKCTYGVEYMICEYDINQRLNTGKGWKYIKSGQLQPGRFYYFTVNGDYNVYSFKAAENTITINNTTELLVNGDGPNANWNAVGNTTLTYATISGENVPAYVQTYVNGESRYITVATSEAQFVVGCPFFFQASKEATMILNEANKTIDAHYAPRQESVDKPVCVRIAEEGKHFSDQIYLTASQEATSEYTLGRDLAKAGIGTKSAQLWMNAYGQKLSVQDATLMGDQAYYELSIYAPTAGSYELSLPKVPANAVIYLTQNGYPIWNLNETPYVIECYKGTTNEYGLLLRLQEGGSPTDMQTMRGSEKVQKIMKDQRIYINANSQLYDLMGQKVK